MIEGGANVERGESKRFRVRARGELACFTRPEMKVERVSYEVMTPSAARGILEAICWKPAVAWRIHAIEVLAPVRWASFRRNEVGAVAIPGKSGIVVDDERQQRNTVALRDVDYVIEASFALTSRAGDGDNVRKFEEMFERRLARGQHHHAPCLGCRELAARVEPGQGAPAPIEPGVTRPLGVMFFDFDWSGFEGGDHRASQPRAALFFHAKLANGVLKVPPREMVRAESSGAAP